MRRHAVLLLVALAVVLTACGGTGTVGASSTGDPGIGLAPVSTPAPAAGPATVVAPATVANATAAPTTAVPTTKAPAPKAPPVTAPPTTAVPRPAPTTPTTAPAAPPSVAAAGGCDPSYPGVCIPPGPPDLDCADIAFRRFAVVGADPHRFDGADDDGIGCENP